MVSGDGAPRWEEEKLEVRVERNSFLGFSLLLAILCGVLRCVAMPVVGGSGFFHPSAFSLVAISTL